MTRARVVVVKIGGSLLASEGLPQRMRAWLETERAARADSHFVLVVGGGKLVDFVREINGNTPLNDEAAHWICIELMEIAGQLVAAMMPELVMVEDFAALQDRLPFPGVTLVRLRNFLRQVEPFQPGTPLPANWSVTSDSIAGRLGVVLGASELVLIKSAMTPTADTGHDSLEDLARASFIDDFLVDLAAELPKLRFSRFEPNPDAAPKSP